LLPFLGNAPQQSVDTGTSLQIERTTALCANGGDDIDVDQVARALWGFGRDA
jgi:hypothetical protein